VAGRCLGLLAREQVTVSELVARAPRYTIVKQKSNVVRNLERMGDVYGRCAPDPGSGADTQDGSAACWPDRWLHVRPSGTEPIIRFIGNANARRRRKTDRRRAGGYVRIVRLHRKADSGTRGLEGLKRLELSRL